MDVKCEVEGCVFLTHRKNPAYCSKHYWRYANHGSVVLPPRKNKRYHPHYIRWHEKKVDCVSAWLDFWAFTNDIGDCPGQNYRLDKIHQAKPWGPNNFQWRPLLEKQEGETDKEWHARKWAEKKQRIPDFEHKRDVQRRFNITAEQYAELDRAQDHKCAICRKPETAIHKSTGKVKRLAVDHCHAKNTLRALLCWRCNATLGRTDDNPELLEAMASYLRRHA